VKTVNINGAVGQVHLNTLEYAAVGAHLVTMQSMPEAGCRWLTPVILATREAKIRKIQVQGHPGQIVLKIPSPK
jgi:hypothetical protein